MKLRRRIIFKLLLFLLAGAIVNVAVAWGCVAWIWNPGPMDGMRDALSRKSSIETLSITRNDSGGATLVFVSVAAGQHLEGFPNDIFHGDTRRLAPRWIELDPPFPEYETALTMMGSNTLNGDGIFLGAGWPMRTLWCQLTRSLVSGQNFLIHEMETGGIAIGREGTVDGDFRVLPLRPIWPCFAINTIFYAAILYAMFALPGAVRRRVRIKRGQCAACGYSLHGASGSVCPECGAVVSTRSTA